MSTDLFSRSASPTASVAASSSPGRRDRPGGFTEEDLSALQRIQRRLAIACKTVIQSRISRNIAEAYLGRETGERVLTGSIRLGDGEQTRALVWYSDLQEFDAACRIDAERATFLELLNVYFECSARPAIAAGGEVLAFVGDAVLAIFPIEKESELPELTRRVTAALNESLALSDRHQRGARSAANLEPIRYGIGLNIGTVMYGNIGVPERLAFSAIGPTVIEVARIEKLTKTIGARVLATRRGGRDRARIFGARRGSIAWRARARCRSSSGCARKKPARAAAVDRAAQGDVRLAIFEAPPARENVGAHE